VLDAALGRLDRVLAAAFDRVDDLRCVPAERGPAGSV